MNKEEWLVIREKEEIPLSLFYEYYVDKCTDERKVSSLEEFEAYFPQFMQHFMGGAIITKNGTKFISFSGIVAKVYDHFNKKYET